MEPKAPMGPIEPKAPKGPIEPKAPKGPIEPKAPKGPIEPKAPKGPIERMGPAGRPAIGLARSLVVAALCGTMLAVLGAFGWVAPSVAHEQFFPIAGKKVLLRGEPFARKSRFVFVSEKDFSSIVPVHDPSSSPSQLLVRALTCAGQSCTESGRSELITLDSRLWIGVGNPPGSKGYKYRDRDAAAGGVKTVRHRPGKLIIRASGDNWSFVPQTAQDEVWVHYRVEDEWTCAKFSASQSLVRRNEPGYVLLRDAESPGACPDQVCGNGILEGDEDCDDGNLDENDGCSNQCTSGGACGGNEFDSTFEAIQSVVFDGYGCTNAACHGSSPGSGNLDLQPATAYQHLVNVPSSVSAVPLDLVEPGEDDLSYLYNKLRWGTEGGPPAPNGGKMPVGAANLTPEHLEAIRLWLLGGAPEIGVVNGTAALLESCLPDPTPVTIERPAPPAAGTGIQLHQVPWPLPADSEDEICKSTYYDFTAPGIVPASARITCPPPYDNIASNPTNECLLFHRQTLVQDPQSHHSIIHIYTGNATVTDPGWGPWTYKFQDDTHPQQGVPCDPTDVDGSGLNPDCSAAISSRIACLGYGPADFGGGLGSGNAPQFSGSQETHYVNEFADGVYSLLPMQGIVTWNSHAFNHSTQDTTMSQYLNVEFADPADQLYPALQIFDSASIFAMSVPPFGTHEICRTYTAPRDSQVFQLGSHTHKWGRRFRIWAPPNTRCTPGEPACVPRGDAPIYLSTVYNDPLQLELDPPIDVGGGNANSRSFLYCSLYDNGSTPTSPPVKRRAGNVSPCSTSQVVCLDGPNKGANCNGNDAFCDSSAGAGDGLCDACPVFGGVRSEDEMFIMLGLRFRP